jgi:GNAT superfamily N-acetyltransferase
LSLYSGFVINRIAEHKMAAGFSVRIATTQDAALVDQVLKASYPKLMRNSYEEATLTAVLPLMTKVNPELLSSGTYYVAEHEDGTILGCGGWTLQRPGTGDVVQGRGHIRHFATQPEQTGLGVGRAIYTRCEDVARSAGIGKFECFSSLNAEGFYAALGFRKVRRLNLEMAPGLIFPTVLMEHSF